MFATKQIRIVAAALAVALASGGIAAAVSPGAGEPRTNGRTDSGRGRPPSVRKDLTCPPPPGTGQHRPADR